jgi:glycosyltransferase involved in cell wall biosynthesis
LVESVRILFATYPWAFQVPGGGERLLLDSRAELLRRGHIVDLFNQWTHNIRDYEIVHYFHSPGWEMWPRIKALGARLVVTPTLWWEPPINGWLARQVRHAIHRFSDPWWSPPFDERDAHSQLMISDLLLPTSEAEASLLETHVGIPRSKMRVIRNAVDAGDSAKLSTDLAHALAHPRALLCVGSFHRVKNQLALIRALRGTDFRVVFVGSRALDDADDYLARCRSAAGDAHWFFPQQPHGVVLEAMRRVRVYVQPSLRETCGLAALEAGALGCRVAITERGATREYFSDFAFYLDPEEGASIQRAIENAWAAPDATRLAKHIRFQHTWQRVGDQLEQAYNTLASGNSGGAAQQRGVSR